MKRSIMVGIIVVATLSAVLPVPNGRTATAATAAAQPSRWAAEEVKLAIDRKLVPAVLQSQWTQTITRQQFCALVLYMYIRLTGSEIDYNLKTVFSDTADPYVLNAHRLGLIKGNGYGRFLPNAPITREELSVMLMNSVKAAGAERRLHQAAAAPVFADSSKIAAWARESMGKLASSGLLTGAPGKGGGMYVSPQTLTTREQSVVLVYRLFNECYVPLVRNLYDLYGAVERHDEMNITDANSRAVYDKAKDILAQTTNASMSDYDKVKAIYDYLILHIRYDKQNADSNTVPESSYNAYGALIGGVAVCQGYAESFKLLLNLAGIEAYVVTGTAKGVGHAWNKIRLDGQIYNADATWDDNDKDGALPDYDYFLVPDVYMDFDHETDHSETPAASSNRYAVYSYRFIEAASPEELQAKLSAAIDEGIRVCMITYHNESGSGPDLAGMIFGTRKISGYHLGADADKEKYRVVLAYK